jgi:hypothetical protein
VSRVCVDIIIGIIRARDAQHEQSAQQRIAALEAEQVAHIEIIHRNAEARIAEARAAAFREAAELARDYAQWLYGLVDCVEKGDVANNVADRIEEAAAR